MRRLHAIVTGKVQGVFFRASTRAEANRLGVTGWVQNLEDGTVELTAEGKTDALEELLRWCHDGPERARVDDVDHGWHDATGAFENFVIRR